MHGLSFSVCSCYKLWHIYNAPVQNVLGGGLIFVSLLYQCEARQVHITIQQFSKAQLYVYGYMIA